MTLKRALMGAALAAACTVPAPAVAHEERPRSGTACTTGMPTYYDMLGAGDYETRIHRKGWHPQPQQHEDTNGHLPPVNRNVDVVGKVELTTELGRVSDVSSLKNYAYMGAYSEPDCSTGGVWVVDIANPAAPRKVGFIRSHEDTYTAEGVHATSITTPSFNGDVLAFSNENCISGTTNNGVGGMTLYDVSNPLSPKKLVEGFGDFTTKGRRGAPTGRTCRWSASSGSRRATAGCTRRPTAAASGGGG